MRNNLALFATLVLLIWTSALTGHADTSFPSRPELSFPIGAEHHAGSEIPFPLNEVEAAADETRADEDLTAQKEMAYWARFSGFLGISTALVSLLAIYMAYQSFKLAQDIAKRQLSPYVHAAEGKFGQSNNVVLKITNDGQTPATQFFVNATSQLVNRGEVSRSINFIDNDYKAWSTLGVGRDLNVSILDGDETIRKFHKSHERGEIMYGEKEMQSLLLLICGQIIYHSVSGETYRTQFAFYIDRHSQRFRRPTARLNAFQDVSKLDTIKILGKAQMHGPARPAS